MIYDNALKKKIADCINAKLDEIKSCFTYTYVFDIVDDDMVDEFKNTVADLVWERGDWRECEKLEDYEPDADVEYEFVQTLKIWYENQEE